MTTICVDRKTTLALIASARNLGYKFGTHSGRWNPENDYWTRLGVVLFEKEEDDWLARETWDTNRMMPYVPNTFRVGYLQHAAILRALAKVAEHADDAQMKTMLKLA